LLFELIKQLIQDFALQSENLSSSSNPPDVPIAIFHPFQCDQNNPFLFEIITSNQDSFNEWFTTTTQDPLHLPRYTLLQPYEGFT
jgi:hypothetical protein